MAHRIILQRTVCPSVASTCQLPVAHRAELPISRRFSAEITATRQPPVSLPRSKAHFPTAMQQQSTALQHDWSPLPLRMLVETGAATLTALSIAPAVAIVDKAIVSNASGRQALLPCVASELKVLLSSPLQFLKQPNFLFILGVYRYGHL